MNRTDHSQPQKGVLHKPWEHTALKALSFGGLATAGLALAPVVAPIFGTSAKVASAAAIDFCTTGTGSGLAAAASKILSQVPLIGGELAAKGGSWGLAAGGWTTAAVSGGLAIGGMWLANYIDKRTPQGAFRWGAVIRWTALTTSILIALPAILPAISMGVFFIGSLMGSAAIMSAATSIGSLGTAGAMSGVSAGLGAAGLAGLHALTCVLPLGATSLFLGEKEEKHKPMPKLQLPAMIDGRVTPLVLQRQAAI